MTRYDEFQRFRRDLNEKILARGTTQTKRFFTLDTKQWRQMNEEERLAFVARVARMAEQARYQGAHFMNTEGQLAGQWRSQQQPRLF